MNLKKWSYNTIHNSGESVWLIYHVAQSANTFFKNNVYSSIGVFIFSFIGIYLIGKNEKSLVYISIIISCLFLIPSILEFYAYNGFIDSNMAGTPISFITAFLIIYRTKTLNKWKNK